MIDIPTDRATRMDLTTAIFQLEAYVASIANEAEMARHAPGAQADIERFVANAAYYVQRVISDASESSDFLRYLIIQLHRDINAANSCIAYSNWTHPASEAETHDADARIMVFMLVLRKARYLAGRCGMFKPA